MKIALCSSILASFLLVSGCAATGEAEDQWDLEEKEERISLDKILGKSKKQKESEELKARIERLEQGNNTTVDPSVNQLPTTTSRSSGGITPPSMNRSSSKPSTNPANSVSYQEWLNAKNGNSTEYKDFKEYQDWLEFKRQQKQ